ncbi:MAG: pyruvate formate lyase-activating protein [Clostridia bacterium]|nr:pyruvate formate lyase-activating protein [Clostridia bacterium]
MTGKITDLETMGSADGPGIRLVLFLSGCKLRCLYCHNPETWNKHAFRREISSEEVLKLYNKYKVYYGEKGGVTFSGGEPLMQSKFVLQTIKLLHQHNIHTAIDTSGVGEDYDEVLKLVDLVILDVKAVDSDEYKSITGRDIKDFNTFLTKCQNLNKKLWLRQVIVPGINDDEQHVLKFKQFARGLSNVERVELLPYHNMGISKYNELGIKYRLESTPNMDKDKCKQLEQLLNN